MKFTFPTITILLTTCYLGSIGQAINNIFTPIEKGAYIGNARVGIWEYWDSPGRMNLSIDYSKGEIVYFQKDTSDFYIKGSDGGWVKSKLDIPCRFHGSIVTLISHYQALENDLLKDLSKSRDPLEFYLTFDVDENATAFNPQVIGNPGSAVEKKILKHFDNAPNYWIVGIKNDSVKICKIALQFSYCPTYCLESNLKPINAKVIFISRVGQWGYKSIKSNSSFGITNENNGIVFSPDDKKIVVESGVASGPIGVSNQSVIVVNLENQEIKKIPFTNTNGATWFGNNEIIFKYKFDHWFGSAAIFNIDNSEVRRRSDSATYFHVASSSGSKVAFASLDKHNYCIWQLDATNLKTRLLIKNPKSKIVPISWSPDEHLLLFLMNEHGFLKYYIIDVTTGKILLVPLYNCQFAGWGKNGKSLFLQKVEAGDYNFSATIYQFIPNTDEINAIVPETKWLYASSYSSLANQFALVIKDDLYLYTPGHEKPSKVIEGVTPGIYWSNNGKFIAYIQKKGQQLYLYSLESKSSKKIGT